MDVTSKYIIPGVKVEAGDTILESSAFRRSLKPKAGRGSTGSPCG